MFTEYTSIDYGFRANREQDAILKEIIAKINNVKTGRVYGFVPMQILGEFSRSVNTETLPIRFYTTEEDFLPISVISEEYLDTVIPFNVSKAVYDTDEEGIRFTI